MTSTTAFTAEHLTEALEAVEIHDPEVRTDYSGRAMYGATCFGVVLGDRDLPKLGLALAMAEHMAVDGLWADGDEPELADFTERAVILLECVRMDDMGRAVIAYFPGWLLATEDTDEEVA